MLSNKSLLSPKIKGREYLFFFEHDSPIDDILEANIQINSFVLGRKVQQQQAQAEKPVEEQPKSE